MFALFFSLIVKSESDFIIPILIFVFFSYNLNILHFLCSLLHINRTQRLSVHSLWLSDLRTTVEMKGFTDELNYIVEMLEGGTTLEDVIDNHIYEQVLVSLLM